MVTPSAFGLCLTLTGLLVAACGWAADWPQWGGRPTRNMVCEEKGLPTTFEPGRRDGSSDPQPASPNVKWVVRLGKITYGNPTVAGGKVFVGTNNGYPRNPRYVGDRGILLCFEEATGKFLWQLVVAKLKRRGPFRGDLENIGLCSSPTFEDGRLYVVTNRCEVLCLDANGLANGNDGPFRDEGEYVALANRRKPGLQRPDDPSSRIEPERAPQPLALEPTDADIVWRFDMIDQLDVWPHAAASGSPLLHGDLLFTCTSNGVDTDNQRVCSPEAPALIALDKRTGALVAHEDAGISERLYHGTWCSPSLAEVDGRALVFFGGPDGVCYAFDAAPVEKPGRAAKTLKLVWACDANPAEYRFQDGKPLPYDPDRGSEGPSEVLGTPVFYKNRVYVTIGRDITHGAGQGALTCIDATQTGDPAKEGTAIWTLTGTRRIPCDITATGKLWQYTAMKRSTATPAIADGLVYVTDFAGDVHCLDAETGKPYWVYKTGRITMGSCFVADGKVYVGNQRGNLFVLAAGKEMKLLSRIRLRDSMDCTPVVANGVLYVATSRELFAVQER